MTIEYTECTSSFFRNLAASVGSNHATRSDPPSRKQGWIPRKTISQGKALVCPQKGNWAFFWIFSFYLCLLSVNLQIQNFSLENHHMMKARQPCCWWTNFSLENHHMMKARQPCCWWMTFTKVSNPPLPPHPYVVDHETFVVEGGIHGDLARCLVWVRTFSQISGVRNCFPDI